MTRLIWVVEDSSPTNAGITIRIKPVIKRLRSQGIEVSLVTFKDIVGSLLNASGDLAKGTYLFSKPHKYEYLACMLALQNLGYRVGIDIFDNYYSESDALREFGVQSIWKNILREADFCIFSTPYLLKYASSLRIDSKYMYVIGDPVYPDWYDPLKIKTSTKWEQFFREQSHIDVIWFGIDSNPYFSAGISDIFCNISRLREFLLYPSWFFNKKITHKIYICTRDTLRSRKLVTELYKIGINVEFVQWSNNVCTQLLEDSHAVFLPTNNNDFVLSKTHNRLVEALSHNCLVYVCPNGLYTQYKSLLCIDSYSEFTHLFENSSSDNDISKASKAALMDISAKINSCDDFSRLCELLAADNADRSRQKNHIFSIVGTINDANSIKILRKARAVIAGVISPLIKSPPSYDHIELIHEEDSITIRCKLERLEAFVRLPDRNKLSANFRCDLRILPDTFLEFRQVLSSDSKYLELNLVDCGQAFWRLLKVVNERKADKSLTFRNGDSRLIIGALYESIYHFCKSYMELDNPVIVSGSSPIGSFLDSLIDTSD